MENLFKVIILAIIQGVTEFLPVSSSGHLVLSKYFMGLESAQGATLEIVLHSGTLISILVFYWRHLGQILEGVFRREKESIRFAKKVKEFNNLKPRKMRSIVAPGIDSLRKKLERDVDIMLTSPPYLQAQEYIRSLKLELFWLGYS